LYVKDGLRLFLWCNCWSR